MANDNIFSGLKVVDVASFVAAPAATTVLSDFGADVIKVEPPDGDPYRHLYETPPNPPLDENYTWQLTSRNKRSIALDLKNPKSTEVLQRLVKWADVFVTNFPPHVKKNLKLTYEDISPLNPRLIYADVTGYGERGPEADKPGFDITAYWARSGLMEFTRNVGSPPALPVPAVGDHATAISLYASIVTALYRRERTGEGGHVTASLVGEGAWAVAAWLQAGLFGAKFTHIDRSKPQNPLAGASYKTSDDRWLMLCFVATDRDWPVFAKAIGREDMIKDPRFLDVKTRAENAEAFVAELDRTIGAQPLAYWKNVLDQARLAYGVAQIAEEIVRDPQLLANDIIVPIAGGNGGAAPRYTVNSPVIVKGVAKVVPGKAPELGEHSDAVLAELGFDAAQIEALHASGAAPKAKGGVPGGRSERAVGKEIEMQASAKDAQLGERLFVLDLSGHRVFSIKPDGSDERTLVTECGSHPDGIFVDVEAGHIYWTDMGVFDRNDGRIERADLDGGNRKAIIPAGATFTPKQLTLDKARGKLYWCDREGMRVMRANLDGSNIETLVERGRGDADRADQTRWCVGIAVDAEQGKIYWTQKGPSKGGKGLLFRAGIDIPPGQSATNRTDIELLFDHLPEPVDLEIDREHHRLYWTDRGDPPKGNTVTRFPIEADAKRGDASEIVMTHLLEGIGISLDVPHDRMFLTDLAGSIYSARLDGSDKRVLAQAEGNLTGIAYAEVPAGEN